MCVLIFSTAFVKHIPFIEEFSEILSQMPKSVHVKYPLLLSDFNETWILSTDFRKNLKYCFIKIRPVGAELFDADRQTDEHDEDNSRFSQFYELAWTRFFFL